MGETVEELIAEGDRVVGRFTFRGTCIGEFMGIAPTGRKVSMTGTDIVRIEGGKTPLVRRAAARPAAAARRAA
jgi:predicted ester cyclase